MQSPLQLYMANTFVNMADIEAKIAATSSSYTEYYTKLMGVKAGVDHCNAYSKQTTVPAPMQQRILGSKDLRSL